MTEVIKSKVKQAIDEEHAENRLFLFILKKKGLTLWGAEKLYEINRATLSALLHGKYVSDRAIKKLVDAMFMTKEELEKRVEI